MGVTGPYTTMNCKTRQQAKRDYMGFIAEAAALAGYIFQRQQTAALVINTDGAVVEPFGLVR